jgi:hypothetical protein
MPAHGKELDIKGPNLWYLVRLITSDGCLSSDGGHIDITSKDFKFLEGVRNFYGFLLSIGFTPNKSLTLGKIKTPEHYFTDFLRGTPDGDGCIRTCTLVLKYGKMAAREISRRCYYRDCFGLERKVKLANKCLDSYEGWSQSKTVLN